MDREPMLILAINGILSFELNPGFDLLNQDYPDAKIKLKGKAEFEISFQEIADSLRDQATRNQIIVLFKKPMFQNVKHVKETISFLEGLTQAAEITVADIIENFSNAMLNKMAATTSDARYNFIDTKLALRNSANDEDSCKKFLDLVAKDKLNLYGTKERILELDQVPNDVLFDVLKAGKLAFFEMLLEYGISPFTLNHNKEASSGNERQTVFNFLLEKQPDSVYFRLCVERIPEIKSLAEITELPIILLEKKGLLTREQLEPLRQIVIEAIDKLNIPDESKLKLKDFLTEPDVSIPGYSLLDRISAIAQLTNFIIYPFKQGQLDQNTCGVNVIFISLAMQAPNVLIHITLSLLRDGYCKFPTNIAANDAIKVKCNNLAKLFNQSLKNSQAHLQGRYVPHTLAANWFHDPTSPDDIVHFLHNFGCSDITDATDYAGTCLARGTEGFLGFLYCKVRANNNHRIGSNFDEDFQSLIAQFNDANAGQGKSCIIFIKATLMIKLNGMAKNADNQYIDFLIRAINNEPLRKYFGINIEHFAVLKDFRYNSQDNSLIDMVIYTWGEETKVSIAKAELESEWLGYIGFKFPDSLKLATLQELSNHENTENTNRLAR